MGKAIRLGAITALLLAGAVARADHDPYTANAPHPDAATAATTGSDGAKPTTATGASKVEASAGAGSMEPGEGIEEDPGTGAHQAWVESIWETP